MKKEKKYNKTRKEVARMKRLLNNKIDITKENNHNFILYMKEKMESLGINNCDIAKLIDKNERTVFNYLNEQTIPSHDCRRKILDYIYEKSICEGFYCMTLSEFRVLLSELYITFRKTVTQEKLAKVAGKSQSEISRYISEPVHDVSKNYYNLKYIDVETQYKILMYYHQYLVDADGRIIDSYSGIGGRLEYWLYDYRNMKDVHKYLEQYVYCNKHVYEILLFQFQNNPYTRKWYDFSELECLEEYYKNAKLIFNMILRMCKQDENAEKSRKNVYSSKLTDIVKIAEKHIEYINRDDENREYYIETLEYLRDSKRLEEHINFMVDWLKKSKAAECYEEMLFAGPDLETWLEMREDFDDYSESNEKFKLLSATKQKVILDFFDCFKYPNMFDFHLFCRDNADFILKMRGLETKDAEIIENRLEKRAFAGFYELISDKEINTLIIKYTGIIQIAESGYAEDIMEEEEEERYVKYERKLGKSFIEYPVFETIETMLQFSSHEWYLQMLYVICINRGYDIMVDIMELEKERKR